MPVQEKTEQNTAIIRVAGNVDKNEFAAIMVRQWNSNQATSIVVLHGVDTGRERTFYRFTNANGDLGGFVESTAWGNMSPTAYIGRNVVAMDASSIRDNAVVFGSVTLTDRAIVSDSAKVNGSTPKPIVLSDDVRVSKNANLRGIITMTGHSYVSGHAHLDGSGKGIVLEDAAGVNGTAHLYDEVKISDTSHATGNADIRDQVELKGGSEVTNEAHIYKNAILWNTIADGDCQIAEQTILLNCAVGGNAHVYSANLDSLQLSGHVWVYDIMPSDTFSKVWDIVRLQKATIVTDMGGPVVGHDLGPNVWARIEERVDPSDMGPQFDVRPGRAIFSSRSQIEEYLKATGQEWPKLEVTAELPAARA